MAAEQTMDLDQRLPFELGDAGKPWAPALGFCGEQRCHGDICRGDENALSRDD